MLTLCIQAGGQSSRMGQDKALLDFGGEPLIQRVLIRLKSLADETIITTNHPEGYRFLGLPLIPDIIPERGALGGLYTALSAATHSLVAVVACDMPFASLALFEACQARLVANPELDAVIPSTEHGLEPLHAVYRRETCLSAVEDALQAGKWRMIGWHTASNVQILTPQETTQYTQSDLTFWNLNTPEDFAAALQITQKPSEG